MKNILSFLMSVLVTLSVCLATDFSDISDPSLKRVTYGLSSLGIISGTGNNQFSPNDNLTRGEFCKIAVMSLGETNLDLYSNVALFPDVLNTHWAAPYINIAVKKYNIIKGFPDGTFRPDEPISGAQACSMILNMLGYTVEDIGPFWPSDYISKTKSLRILDNTSNVLQNPNKPLLRSDAAIILSNTLVTNKKEGDILLKSSFSNVISDSILLATDKTDSDLNVNTAKFYENGDEVIRQTKGQLDISLIGCRGYAVFDKTQIDKIMGFLPQSSNTRIAKIIRPYADKLETNMGTFKVASKTNVVINGQMRKYSDAWFDLIAGSNINIYYSENSSIDTISLIHNSLALDSFIYGISGSYKIPDNYTIVKNGYTGTSSDVKKYDVITLDSSTKTAHVSDKKVTGVYSEGLPATSHPSSVEILNTKFTIEDSVSSYFKDFRLGDKITLILDQNLRVIAAFPASNVSSDMFGMLKSLDNDSVTISLFSGIEFTAEVDKASTGTFTSGGETFPNTKRLIGKPIQCSERSDNSVTIKSVNLKSVSGDLNLSKNILGSLLVSDNVKLYEQPDVNAKLTEINRNDIDTPLIPNRYIKGIISDSAGNITHIVLTNVTGCSYDYGITSIERQTSIDWFNNQEFTNSSYVIRLNTPSGKKSYRLLNQPGAIPKVGGIPRGMSDLEYRLNFDVKALNKIDSVSINKFDSDKGVNTLNGYYKLSKDVIVYIPDRETFVSLNQAKSNYTEFTLYADNSLNPKVRVIYAK